MHEAYTIGFTHVGLGGFFLPRWPSLCQPRQF
jgi:hypothetical protein